MRVPLDKLDGITRHIVSALLKKGERESLAKLSGGLQLIEEDGVYYTVSRQDERKIADGQFIFVTPVDPGEPILVGVAINGSNAHAKLSVKFANDKDGTPALEANYAGEVYFQEGKLIKFNNQSQTFQFDSDPVEPNHAADSRFDPSFFEHYTIAQKAHAKPDSGGFSFSGASAASQGAGMFKAPPQPEGAKPHFKFTLSPKEGHGDSQDHEADSDDLTTKPAGSPGP